MKEFEVKVDGSLGQDIVVCPETVSERVDFVVESGFQGPPGPPTSALHKSGVSFAQDTQPSDPEEDNTWWNPLTRQLKVYHNGAWRSVAPDGGHF